MRGKKIDNAALCLHIARRTAYSTVANGIRRFNRKFLQALVNVKQTVEGALIVISYNTWLII